jgi:hypothetical protein
MGDTVNMRMDDLAEVISTPMQYALRYTEFGWPVFACRVNDKRPIAQGGFHTASTEPEQVRAMWQQHPRANVGIPAGAHWWVLDVDPRHGGHETLASLEGQHGELPPTLTARTPSGGMHYYFRSDRRARNSVNKLGAGLDTRADGGYVLVEGSSVNGGRYQFQDWDPLCDSPPFIAPAPEWLMAEAFTGKNREAIAALDSAEVVPERVRNDFLTRQAGRLRHIGCDQIEIEAALMAINASRCVPPLPSDEVRTIAASVSRYAKGEERKEPEVPPHIDEAPPVGEPERTSSSATPQSRIVDFTKLAATKAPDFKWYVPGWLSPHPTLMSGKGGMGKSLAALQMAVALATGKRFLSKPVDPLRILLWSCEEDLPELHRRLERICEFYGINMADLAGNLTIDCRQGLDNTLISQEFGRPMWSALTEYLRQQVNDLKADIWIGDNLAHMYACSENDRHPVTTFTSWLAGLREGWCPLLIGHVAKIGGSEYSGSTAWENAVRMRWYLGDKLPEEDKNADEHDDGEPGNVRFLCKRKTNYDQKDYVRFTMQDGLLVPERIDSGDSGLIESLRNRKARDVILRGLDKLTEMGINTSERGGQANLVKLMFDYKLAEGCSPKQLTTALRQLMVEGVIIRGETGRDASRRKREGLIIVRQAGS